MEQAVHLGSDVLEAKYRIRELGISDSVAQGGQMSLLRPGNSTLSPSGPVAILLCVCMCVCTCTFWRLTLPWPLIVPELWPLE